MFNNNKTNILSNVGISIMLFIKLIFLYHIMWHTYVVCTWAIPKRRSSNFFHFERDLLSMFSQHDSCLPGF